MVLAGVRQVVLARTRSVKSAPTRRRRLVHSVETMTTTTLTTSPATSSTVPRWGALSGLAFVALLLVHATIAINGLPSVTASAQDLVDYATDQKTGLQLGAYLQGVAMIAFLWFNATLFQRFRSPLSWVAMAGATGTVALLGIHISLMTVLALRGEQLSADVVTFIWLLAFLVLGMSSFTVAATMIPAGLLLLRSDALPTWLGVAALVDAAAWLLGGVGGASTADIWGVFGMVAFVGWLAWIAVTSVVLLKGRTER
jgi:hypothetical protein